jgi:hypothetical protein
MFLIGLGALLVLGGILYMARARLFGGVPLAARIPPGRFAILWSRHGAACDSWGSERTGPASSLWQSVQSFCWCRGPVSSLGQPGRCSSAETKPADVNRRAAVRALTSHRPDEST